MKFKVIRGSPVFNGAFQSFLRQRVSNEFVFIAELLFSGVQLVGNITTI